MYSQNYCHNEVRIEPPRVMRQNGFLLKQWQYFVTKQLVERTDDYNTLLERVKNTFETDPNKSGKKPTLPDLEMYISANFPNDYTRLFPSCTHNK